MESPQNNGLSRRPRQRRRRRISVFSSPAANGALTGVLTND
jgi:hypothetical protein